MGAVRLSGVSMRQVTVQVSVMAVLLSSCATSPEACDPTTGGFFGGLSCQASGAYEQRIQQRQQVLREEQAAQSELAGNRSRLESEQARKEAQVARQHKQIRTLERRVASLTQQVDQLQAKSPDHEIDELKRRVTRLKSATQDLERQNTQGRLSREQFEKRNADLQEQLDGLLQIVGSYGK